MSKKNNRRALFCSVISLLLCVSMLLGTTLAWFTDTVSSTGNIIKTGKLDVAMEYTSDLAGEWKDASEETIFSGNLWEPGYSDMKFIRVSNTGNLAFRYQMHVLPAVKAADGEVDLADVIDVYIGEVGEGFTVPSAFAADMAGMSKLGTLAELMEGTPATGVLLPVGAESTTEAVGSVTYCIVLHMQETAGNEYQNLTVGNNFTVQLVATQMGYEQDAFGSSYDADADYTALKNPDAIFNEEVVETVVVDEEQKLAEEVILEGDAVSAEVPAGVKLADGVETLTLTVETVKASESEANISLSSSEVATSVDVHMEGVAEDNTVPMLITLEGLFAANLNQGNYTMYHVENGETVAMTCVDTMDELDAHNEFYYDAATGNVVMCVASFSEYVAVTDNKNLWQGGFNYDWYVGKSSPYTISSADQLAGFGAIVDGTAAGIAADSFAGKIVKLGADIDLSGGYSLNPIGCGYVNGTTNTNSVEGRAFSGTFDGNGKTISNLYQNGWDLGLSYCTLGGGLFASIADGTVKNLTITGADIKMECVEQGILVGLSQGTCIYENINIHNSKVANYQRATGGLIGEVSPNKAGNGTTTINNVTIGSNVVVGTLWGDFDAPVGGVIGAKWDDTDTITIEMTDVDVYCRLDVYSDVTSAYQWYAYRRAGMLIGNTEEAVKDGDRTVASAAYGDKSFLICKNVTVNYRPWVKYHYCEFTNQDDSWQNGYPWVRVEAGENCPAYSNPRYGHPVVEGVEVKGEDHTCTAEHKREIVFNQLYGGGQGVYGQPEHDGVTVKTIKYTIAYMKGNEVLKVDYIEDNSSEKKINYTISETGKQFEGWVTIAGAPVSVIPAQNETDYVLYPKWQNLYTARFVDHNGELKGTATFNPKTGALTSGSVPADYQSGEYSYSWSHYESATKGADGDVVVGAAARYSGVLDLIPQYDNMGNVTHYAVGGIKNQSMILLDIPKSHEGKEVTTINAGAFEEFDRLHAVVIPKSITTIGANTFAADGKNETQTLYYEGSYEEWQKITLEDEWLNGLSSNTRIFFLNGGETVDSSQGYIQIKRSWIVIGYRYTYDYNESWGNGFNYAESKCDCRKESCLDENGNAKLRPDHIYWPAR